MRLTWGGGGVGDQQKRSLTSMFYYKCQTLALTIVNPRSNIKLNDKVVPCKQNENLQNLYSAKKLGKQKSFNNVLDICPISVPN